MESNLSPVTVTVSRFEQEFKICLAGVTYCNADGTDRQSLLKKCRSGEEVELRREPDNPHDKFAISVVTARGEILGYIPAGDRRLANEIDRGFQIRASIVAITGGPNLLQRLIGLRGKRYGCVLRIVIGDPDWKSVAPWMDANREIDNLMKVARLSEKDLPQKSIAQYRGVIAKIMTLDSHGSKARAWRTVKYPIDRLSLLLARQDEKAEALAEIARWRQYADPVGISDAECESITKREARLAKDRLPTNTPHAAKEFDPSARK